jgi:hypothetical protein
MEGGLCEPIIGIEPFRPFGFHSVPPLACGGSIAAEEDAFDDEGGVQFGGYVGCRFVINPLGFTEGRGGFRVAASIEVI